MKIKVVHILNSKAYAGAENVVINIIKKMSEMYGYEFLYVSPKGPIEEILKINNINYVLVDKIKSKELSRIIKSYKPNIVHAHDFTTSIVASKCARTVPIISHLHNNRPWIKSVNIRSVVYYLSSFKYNKILGVSNAIFKEYIFSKKIKQKSIVVGNPIDIKGIISKVGHIKNLENLYDVVYVGRLSESKDPERYIEIINTLRKKNRNIKSAMVGDGELWNLCRDKIKNMELEGNIDMLGFIQSPYEIIKKSKIHCMPSKWEGYGLAAIESLALGVPVIANNVGGLRDIIDEECGYLCENDEEFISEISLLLLQDDVRNLKSKKAKEKSKKLDNIDCYMKTLDEIYRSTLIK